jgi:hypothetical protein
MTTTPSASGNSPAVPNPAPILPQSVNTTRQETRTPRSYQAPANVSSPAFESRQSFTPSQRVSAPSYSPPIVQSAPRSAPAAPARSYSAPVSAPPPPSSQPAASSRSSSPPSSPSKQDTGKERK